MARYAPDESRAKTGALSTSKLSADAAWDALDPTARIHVVRGKVEDVTIPEHVDVIISEPLGLFQCPLYIQKTRMTTHVKQSYAERPKRLIHER